LILVYAKLILHYQHSYWSPYPTRYGLTWWVSCYILYILLLAPRLRISP